MTLIELGPTAPTTTPEEPLDPVQQRALDADADLRLKGSEFGHSAPETIAAREEFVAAVKGLVGRQITFSGLYEHYETDTRRGAGSDTMRRSYERVQDQLATITSALVVSNSSELTIEMDDVKYPKGHIKFPGYEMRVLPAAEVTDAA